LTVSITLASNHLFHNNPLHRSIRVLCSPAHSSVRCCGHHRFCYLRYQETQNFSCARETSPAPRSSSLPSQLNSNAGPRPEAARTAPDKPKETRLTELLHSTLLLDADLAPQVPHLLRPLLSTLLHPSEAMCSTYKKTKQTAHAEILHKTKAYLHQFQSPTPLPWPLTHLALPFPGSLVALTRAAPSQNTHRHRLTLHMPPLTMGFKEERKLSARTMTP